VRIESWRKAICGAFLRKICLKPRTCNYLHVFRNPTKEFVPADRDWQEIQPGKKYGDLNRTPQNQNKRNRTSEHNIQSEAPGSSTRSFRTTRSQSIERHTQRYEPDISRSNTRTSSGRISPPSKPTSRSHSRQKSPYHRHRSHSAKTDRQSRSRDRKSTSTDERYYDRRSPKNDTATTQKDNVKEKSRKRYKKSRDRTRSNSHHRKKKKSKHKK